MDNKITNPPIDLNQLPTEGSWFHPTDPFEEEAKPVEFIVEGYCAHGLITVIGGSGGSGKSLLNQYLLQMRDDSLLPSFDGRALYLTGADSSENEIRRRAAAIGVNYGLDSVDLPIDKLCTSTNPEFFVQLECLIQKKGYDAVVFDTLADFHDGNLIEADKANITMKAFSMLARNCNVAVIIITHTRKGSKVKSSYDVEDISDSRIYTTKADFVFALKSEYQSDGTNLIELQCLKSRSSEPIPPLRASILLNKETHTLQINKSNDLFGPELSERTAAEQKQYKVDQVHKLKHKGRSNQDIADSLGISKGSVNNYLHKEVPSHAVNGQIP